MVSSSLSDWKRPYPQVPIFAEVYWVMGCQGYEGSLGVLRSLYLADYVDVAYDEI